MVIDDYNHDGPWSQWREAAEGSRMHHAWIFAGNKGLGKKSLLLLQLENLSLKRIYHSLLVSTLTSSFFLIYLGTRQKKRNVMKVKPSK